MESTGSLRKIEKLSNDNFHSWQQKSTLVLSYGNLYSHVHDEAKPEDSSDWTEKYMQAIMACMSFYDMMDVIVIGLSLSDEHLAHVQGLTTAR